MSIGKTKSCIIFSTSCFLQTISCRRAEIVIEALRSWDYLLKLDFENRVFVDDRSPQCTGIQILEQAGMSEFFDEIHYVPFQHSPHPNFGIVYSYGVGGTGYVLHLDDDVSVSGSQEECFAFLSHAVRLMDQDPRIMGINLLTLDDPKAQSKFIADVPYKLDPTGKFAHPAIYFGTCASLIRTQLLKKVTLHEIIQYGDQQPNSWEQLVSDDVQQFLVATVKTPFRVQEEAWKIKSTTPP